MMTTPPTKYDDLITDKEHILVIDDKFENLHFLVDILMSKGYNVRPAPTASLAFQSIQLKLPDLILLDIKMPDMNGYRVCEHLKADQRTVDIPVIFLSALDETEDKIKAFGVGGVDYITKPFQPLEVLARVEMHLSLRKFQRQAQRAVMLEERYRLARDLHDSVVQTLFSSTLFVEAGRELAHGGDVEGVLHQLERTNQLIQQALHEMRLLLYQLRPPALEEGGLIQALQKRLYMLENLTEIQTLLFSEEIELSKNIEEELYWIAQEALNNILKHAQASLIRLTLRREGTHVILEICDNGRGFELESLSKGRGMGLSNMRARAEKLGGTLKIHSQLKQGAALNTTNGTTIHVSVEVS